MRGDASPRDSGYDAGLLSLGALPDASHDRLIAHCRTIADIIPVFGFYLQPAVGGRLARLRLLARVPRHRTGRRHQGGAVQPLSNNGCRSRARRQRAAGRSRAIHRQRRQHHSRLARRASCRRQRRCHLHFPAGCWVNGRCGRGVRSSSSEPSRRAARSEAPTAYEILSQSAALTDANAALFDARNDFAGCIAGLHEVLRRQGLLAGRWCLDPNEDLSPGQMEEIDRVCRAYPQLQDDDFVAAHLTSGSTDRFS